MSEAVKRLGEADRAITASTTARMRILLRSMPPTMVLPTCEAVGSCSSMSSAMNGRSGLILDVVVETGNPADAERFLPMLERQIAHSGVPPRQVAARGRYASPGN